MPKETPASKGTKLKSTASSKPDAVTVSSGKPAVGPTSKKVVASTPKAAGKASSGSTGKAASAKPAPKPRDKSKTERNRIIAKMTAELRGMLPQVLAETGWPSEASLNAVIGGKAADFIDLHHEQILSAEAYVSLYMKG